MNRYHQSNPLALNHFGKCEELGFPIEKLYIRVCLAKLCGGDIMGAINCLDGLLEAYPNLADAYIFRAKLYRQLNECFRCNKDMVKAGSIESNHLEIKGLKEYILQNAVKFKNKASEQISRGDNNIAVWFLNKAIELEPRDWKAQLSRGILLSELNDFEAALVDISTARAQERYGEREQQINRYMAHIYNKQAIGLFGLCEFDAAIIKLTDAISFNPSDSILFKNRAGKSINIDF